MKALVLLEDIAKVLFTVIGIVWLLAVSSAVGGAIFAIGTSSFILGLLMFVGLWLLGMPKLRDIPSALKTEFEIWQFNRKLSRGKFGESINSEDIERN